MMFCAEVEEVTSVDVKLVWYPAWTVEKDERYARIALGVVNHSMHQNKSEVGGFLTSDLLQMHEMVGSAITAPSFNRHLARHLCYFYCC